MNKLLTDIDVVSVSVAKACEIEKCKVFLPDPSKSLTILTQNIRSINKNMDNLYILLKRLDTECDIIVLTECWLSKCQQYLPSLSGYQTFSSKTVHNQNDGVVVYAKQSLNVSVEEPSIQDCSRLLIKVGLETAILAIYRPCAFKQSDNFVASLDETLQKLSLYKNVVLTGDMNIDINPENSDRVAKDYLNMCACKGLLPAHLLPTHLSGSCLDHTMLKTNLASITLVTDPTVSDHGAVLLSLNIKTPRSKCTNTFTKINMKNLEYALHHIDFDPVYKTDDVNISLPYLINNVQYAIVNNTSYIKLTKKNNILKPWITPGLVKCIQHKDKLHMHAKSSPDNTILQTSYKRYRNFCNNLLKKLKNTYNRNLLEESGKDSKKLWRHIKNLAFVSKQHESSSELLQTHDSPLTSANHVNSYFVNVGQNLAEQIKCNYNTNYNMHVHKATVSSEYRQLTSFVLLDTDKDEVEKVIMGLKEVCAVGWDGISNSVLKNFRHILVPPLTHIFQICLSESIFPDYLKKALVVPVHKAGDKKVPSNYRPISILSSTSKILEKLINNRLLKYLESKSILSDNQFGFRPKLSTADAVQNMIDYISQELDKGNHSIGIFLDLAKAFDTVSVPILLNKLEKVGIRGKQLKLFADYLSNRSQCVKIDNCTSSELKNTSFGVPQGSILGPTIFLIYINDLCSLKLNSGKIISYADDTVLLFSANTLHEVWSCAQQGFNTVNKWLQHNLLTLNADKTKYIRFSLRNTKPSIIIPDIHAHVCNTVANTKCKCPIILNTKTIKYLGVIIDDTLTFKNHIELLCSRVRKLMFIFKKIRPFADSKVIKQVYYALCQSIITYCITTWGGAAKTILLPLERAQRAVLKVSTFRPILFPTQLLYQSCNVLTVRQLFILNTLLKQHTKLPYNSLVTDRRRKDICMDSYRLRHSFMYRFFIFLGPFLYNKVNAILSMYALKTVYCKNVITTWLQNLSYDDTEKLLIVLS